MKKNLLTNIAFIVIIVVGFLFLDKKIAISCHKYLNATWIYNQGVWLGSFTSSVQFRVLALILGLIGGWKICRGNYKTAQKYTFIFLSFFAAYFIAFGLKFWLARYRPEMLFSDNLFGFHYFSTKHCMTSFPSGHTVSAFSIAFAIMFLIRNKFLLTLIFILASISGLCRILITAHYFTDVVTSIYLAYLVSNFLHFMFKKTMQLK